jgi:hypothetical protein
MIEREEMKTLSKTLFIAITITLIAAFATNVWAESKWSFDGQIRLRDEYDLKSTDSSRHSKVFHELRTRLGVKFEPTDKTMVYVQFQDSRRLGDPSSGGLNSTENVDLHQAYFQIQDAIFSRLWIKAGRFELNYGNQRVFGSVGWHNVGRSWEGALFSYRHDHARADLFYLKRMEMNDQSYDRDFDVYGVYGTLPSIKLDLFGFYELHADSNNYVQERLKRYNLGTYYTGSFSSLDFTLQGVFQFGQQPRDTLPNRLVQDISAFMFTAEAGYTFDGRGGARVAAGVDYSSGDDGKDSTKYKTYTNAYYTGHKFRGFMDKFIPSEKHGLVDLVLMGKIRPAERWETRLDFHYFKAAADYLSKSDTVLTKNIGSEIDLTVANKSLKGVTLVGGGSLFFADKHYSESGDKRETGIWAYLMTIINF